MLVTVYKNSFLTPEFMTLRITVFTLHGIIWRVGGVVLPEHPCCPRFVQSMKGLKLHIPHCTILLPWYNQAG